MEVLYLPGLASDHRLFSPLIGKFGGKNLSWLKPDPKESIPDYSKRFAHSLSKENAGDICLVGLCFGGVVAMEMAQHMPLHSLITLNTPGDSNDISPDFRKGVQIGKKLPQSVLKGLLAMKGASFFKEKDQLNDQQTQLVRDMVSDLDLAFLTWAAEASAGWDRATPLAFKCPKLSLHGESDSIVRRPKNMPTELMKGAGHLAPMTHPEVLSTHLEQFWKNIPSR